MIYDKLENLESYRGLAPRVLAGLEALRDTDFAALADGDYPLDGDKLYMKVMTLSTKAVNDRPEAHKRYIDIQYVLEGEERIGVAALDDMDCEVEANPAGDIWFYRGTTSELPLSGSRFVVLFPQDAHAPCIAVGEPKTIRKVVVKVLV